MGESTAKKPLQIELQPMRTCTCDCGCLFVAKKEA
jgi:hypothetical protein